MRAPHQAAAKRDRFRRETGHQVRNAYADVVALSLHRLKGESVATFSHTADLLGGQIQGQRDAGWSIVSHPVDHGGPRCHPLPTTVSTAVTEGAGGFDHVMSDLGMRSVFTAVQLAIEHHSASDAGADGDVDETALAASCAPGGFGQRGRISVIFNRDGDAKFARQRSHQIRPLPSGEVVDPSVNPSERINRAAAANANTGEFDTRLTSTVPQHLPHAIQGMSKSMVGGCRRLLPTNDFAVLAHHTYGDFCSPDVNGPYHVFGPSPLIVAA